jgi:2-phosphosulfolactate phosphatase
LKVHVTSLTGDLRRTKTLVLVDVLRSSSTIITALSNGAKSVIPFTNLLKALEAHRRATLDTVLAGERHGITPKGFDYNISPFEMSRENVSGKTVLYSSSNLTRILGKLRARHRILIGGVINARAVANYLQSRYEDVAIVACGTKFGTAVEDLVGAGFIAASFTHAEFSDDALAAIGSSRAKGWRDLVKRGRVASRLIELGFEMDIDFCISPNSSQIVPGLVGDKLVDVKRSSRLG